MFRFIGIYIYFDDILCSQNTIIDNGLNKFKNLIYTLYYTIMTFIEYYTKFYSWRLTTYFIKREHYYP